jgi:hypothetical protein
MAVMYAHVQGTATPVTQMNRNLPEPVGKLVHRLMAVDANKRYQSMDDVRMDLGRFIDEYTALSATSDD